MFSVSILQAISKLEQMGRFYRVSHFGFDELSKRDPDQQI